jgi:hypothetical protein
LRQHHNADAAVNWLSSEKGDCGLVQLFAARLEKIWVRARSLFAAQ